MNIERLLLTLFFIFSYFSIDGFTEIKIPFGTPDATQILLNIVKRYLPENAVILDAGAFDGEETRKMPKGWTIHAFEPVPEIFGWLTKKTKDYPNIHCYQLALSDKNGIAPFYVSEEPYAPGIPSQSSSLLAPKDHLKYSATKFKKQIEVTTVTLDDWAKANNIDHLDFMWLDMQGYELNMMKASPAIMKTVRAIFTEVEFVEAYAGQYLYKDVRNWLEEQGFVLVARNFDVRPTLWFGDALFVRKELL